jgi:hypothetical protein
VARPTGIEPVLRVPEKTRRPLHNIWITRKTVTYGQCGHATECVFLRITASFGQPLLLVLAHSLVKDRQVPPHEIEEAIRRNRKFELDPKGHTYSEG